MNKERQQLSMKVAKILRYYKRTGLLAWSKNSGKQGQAVCHTAKDGYLMIFITMDGIKCRFMAHRIAWLKAYRTMPTGEIDHINGDRSDNRIENLRDVPKFLNSRNAAKRKDNTSGVSGVYWDSTANAWRAAVRVNGSRRYVGVYHSLDSAKVAVNDFRAANEFTERHGT